MEHDESIFEIVGSGPRLRTIQSLSQRPRAVRELSELLGLTTQAVLKHLKVLEQAGIVSKVAVRLRVGLIRGLYRLRVPISVRLVSGGAGFAVHLLLSEREQPKAGKLEKRNLAETLGRFEEERYFLERRLKSSAEREERAFRDLARILTEEDALLTVSEIDPVEEALLRASLISEDELLKTARVMKISPQETRKILQPFLDDGGVK